MRQPNPNPSESPEDSQPGAPKPEVPSLSAVAHYFAEIAGHFSYSLSGLFNRDKVSPQKLLWTVAPWLTGIIVVSAIFIAAILFVFHGASLGLADLLGNRLWLSYLLLGLFFLILTSVVIQIKRTKPQKKPSVNEQGTVFGLDPQGQDALVHLLSELDPRSWTQKYPWQAIGIAALVGFVAAAQKSAPQQSKKTLRLASESTENQSLPPSILGLLAAAGIEIITSALIPVVTAEVKKRMKDQP